MKPQTKRFRVPSVCTGLSFSILLLALFASCSDTKTDSGSALDTLYAEVRNQADPIAQLTAGIVVSKLPSQGAQEANAEIKAKHGPTVEPFKDSLCAELKDAVKDAGDDEIDQVRATANVSLRDAFVLNFVRAASAASPERASEIAQAYDIKSKGPDGSALSGTATLKDASLSMPDGSVRIPPANSAEYTQYTDWLMNNEAVAGLITSLTQDYEEAVRDCALE